MQQPVAGLFATTGQDATRSLNRIEVLAQHVDGGLRNREHALDFIGSQHSCHGSRENSDIVLHLAGVNDGVNAGVNAGVYEYRGLRVVGDAMRKPYCNSDQFGRLRES
jgi:hypothetical protein